MDTDVGQLRFADRRGDPGGRLDRAPPEIESRQSRKRAEQTKNICGRRERLIGEPKGANSETRGRASEAARDDMKHRWVVFHGIGVIVLLHAKFAQMWKQADQARTKGPHRIF